MRRILPNQLRTYKQHHKKYFTLLLYTIGLCTTILHIQFVHTNANKRDAAVIQRVQLCHGPSLQLLELIAINNNNKDNKIY